jgi:hypothetical protein
MSTKGLTTLKPSFPEWGSNVGHSWERQQHGQWCSVVHVDNARTRRQKATMSSPSLWALPSSGKDSIMMGDTNTSCNGGKPSVRAGSKGEGKWRTSHVPCHQAFCLPFCRLPKSSGLGGAGL